MKEIHQSSLPLAVKLMIGGAVLALIGFGLLYWLARVVLEKFEPDQVLFWAALVTAGLPFLIVSFYALGFYLGKVEARGALSGIDQATERIAKVVGETVNVRDSSRINVKAAMQQGEQQAAPIYLFQSPSGHPEFRERSQENNNNRVLDID